VSAIGRLESGDLHCLGKSRLRDEMRYLIAEDVLLLVSDVVVGSCDEQMLELETPLAMARSG
jgi:hypothetical protein